MLVLAAGCAGDGTPAPPGPGTPPAGLVAPGGPQPDGYTELPGPVARAVAWNWVVYVQDNLWTAGGARYAVWVTPDGAPVVGRREAGGSGAGTGAGWETADLSAVPGNPLGAPTVADPHRVYAIAVDADGHVHVAGNMHSSRLRYVRSTRPHDLTDWQDADMIGVDEEAVSYPVFVAGPDGSLLFFYRDGTSAGGDLVQNTLPAGSDRWERTGVVLAGRDVGAAPYPQHIVVDDRDRIHVVHVWRTGAGAEGNRLVSAVVSPDGGDTWRTVDGRALSAPVGLDPAAVALSVPDDVVVVNQGGAVADAEGHPTAVFRVRGRDGAARPLWLVRHDGTDWHVEEVPGSERAVGRPALLAHDGGLLVVWPTGASGGTTTVQAAAVAGSGVVEPGRTLLELPVADWEPVLDRQAAADGWLALLVPVPERERNPDGADGAASDAAAVVSYRLDRLVDRRRRHGRVPSATRGAAAAAAHPRRSAAPTSPISTIVGPASSRNTARCCGVHASHSSARAAERAASRP